MMTCMHLLVWAVLSAQTVSGSPVSIEPGLNLIIAVHGTEMTSDQRELLKELRPGGVVLLGNNIKNKQQTRLLVREIKEAVSGGTEVADLPLIYIDQEGGRINRLRLPKAPSAADIGQWGDEQMAGDTGKFFAEEAVARGIGVLLAPVLDLCVPAKGSAIGDRSFGEDPARAWQLGKAVAFGVREGGALPVVKHFPGHGRATWDSHQKMACLNVSGEELQIILQPFKQAAHENFPAMMVGHIACEALDPKNPHEPASLSRAMITELVREAWKYNGLIITDDLSMQAVQDEMETAVIKSLRAGCDAAMVCGGNAEDLLGIAQAIANEAQKDPQFAELMAASQKRLGSFRGLLVRESEPPAPKEEANETLSEETNGSETGALSEK